MKQVTTNKKQRLKKLIRGILPELIPDPARCDPNREIHAETTEYHNNCFDFSGRDLSVALSDSK
jgi:hypothetical protein